MVEHLEWEELSMLRKSLIPGEGFFRVDRDEPTVDEDRLDDVEVVVVADPDADGLTAAAIIEELHGEITLVPTEPHRFERTLKHLAPEIEPEMTVYILDLSPDSLEEIESALETLVEKAKSVSWFDHHQWEPSLEESVRDAGVILDIGSSDEVCTADVTLESLNGSFDERWDDLVEVVRDHDLWIREDPRSDDIADFAYWSEPTEFIETVRAHGADLPPEAEAFIEVRRAEKNALIELAVSRAELLDIEGYTVGITYGRCSQNEVAQALREQGAEAAVVIKPSGGISLRGTDSFQRCHEVAGQLGGGGHPKAAGCKPKVFDDMLDYAYHWTTNGSTARHLIIQAFRSVLNDQSK